MEIKLTDWQRGMVHCVLTRHPNNFLNHSYNSLHSVVPEFWPWESCFVASYPDEVETISVSETASTIFVESTTGCPVLSDIDDDD